MSPQTHTFDKLEYEVFADFSKGLWERGDDRECPRNGLLGLTDAYPLPTGGLRAWGSWQPMTMTGIPTNAYILGLWSFGGVDPLAGIYTCTLECDSNDIDNSTFRLQKLSGTTNGGTPESAITGGTWTTLHTISSVKAFGAWTHLTPYRFTTGASNVYRIFYNVGMGSSLFASSTASEGIYKTDGSTAARSFYWPFPADCFGHQLSLMFTAIEPGAGLTLHNQIAYTNVASDAQPTTVNAFFPLPNYSSPITWVSPIEPSDLIVAKSEVGLALVQGDVTSPIQRQISFAHAVSTVRPVNTDIGLAISVSRDSVYVWTGSQMRDIAYQLLGNPTEPPFFGSKTAVGFDSDIRFDISGEPAFRVASWGHTGQMDFGEYFLFAGNDYVFDERTEAWFKTTRTGRPQEAIPARFCADRVNDRIYQARHMTHQTGRQILFWENLQEKDYHRSSSYTFTLPLIYSEHGLIQLRELEYYLGVFGRDSRIEVTIDFINDKSEVQSITLAPKVIPNPKTAPLQTGAAPTNQVVRIGDIPGRAAVAYKVTTRLSAPTPVEAPMLERVLVGTAPTAVRYPNA